MKVSKKFYLTLLIIASNVFGMELLPEDLRKETHSRHLNFTLREGTTINRTVFEKVNQDSESKIRYFSLSPNNNSITKNHFDVILETEKYIQKKEKQLSKIRTPGHKDAHLITRIEEKLESNKKFLHKQKTTYSKDLTPGELDRKQLSYLYKRNNNKLFILFSYYFLISPDHKNQSVVYADLINDAFSIDESLNHLKIYARLESESMGVGHAQFMEITCDKEENNIYANLKIVDSRYTNKTQNNDHDIKIKDIFKNFKDIELQEISHKALGIQNCINMDCNIFANTLLYLKWNYDVDPEDIKNYHVIHKAMKHMVETGVFYEDEEDEEPVNFVGKAVNIIGKLSKKVGERQRDMLGDVDEVTWSKSFKLLPYKLIEWSMKTPVFLGKTIVNLVS